MFKTSSEKTTHAAVQQKAAATTFFRKAGEESFFGEKARPSFFTGAIQPKLSVSSPDDPQEKEADAVAEKVMRMEAPATATAEKTEEERLQRREEDKEEVQAKPAGPLSPVLQRQQDKEEDKVLPKCEECKKEEGKLHTKIFTKPAVEGINFRHRKSLALHSSDVIQCSGRGPPANSPSFEQSLADSKGGGSALPVPTKHDMESRFGADFSGVRIHTGSGSEQMSRSINAKAFTHGNDIYFNSGQYSPGTKEGGALLAHELTHVIQQGGSKTRKANDRTATDSMQKEGLQKNTSSINDNLPTANGMREVAKENNSQNGDALPAGELTNLPPPGADPTGKQETGKNTADENTEKAKNNIETPLATASPGASQPPSTLAGNTKASPPPAGEKDTPENRLDKQASEHTSSIFSANNSPVKPYVVAECVRINADHLTTVANINNLALERKATIRGQFATSRASALAFITETSVLLAASVAAISNIVRSRIAAFATMVNNFITTISAAAIGLITQTIGSIISFVSGVITAVGKTINGVSSSVIGYLNRLELPNLPGIGLVRRIITNGIETVTSLLGGLLGMAQTIISTVMVTVMNFITNIIQSFTSIITTIINAIQNIINSIIRQITNILVAVIVRVGTALARLVNAVIKPVFTRAENMVIGWIESSRRAAIEKAANNRTSALKHLEKFLQNSSANGISGQQTEMNKAPPVSPRVVIMIGLIGTKAIQANKQIVTDFDRSTASVWAMIWQQVMSSVRQVITQIRSIAGRVRAVIDEAINTIINMVVSYVQSVIATVNRLYQLIVRLLNRLYDAFVHVINHPIETITKFATGIFSTVVNFFSNLVRRAISSLTDSVTGNRSVNSQPAFVGFVAPAFLAPAPVIVEVIVIVVEVIVVCAGLYIIIIEGEGIIIVIGAIVIFIPEEAVVVVIVVVVIIVILLLLLLVLLLYLLLRTTPKPIPIPIPKPIPRPIPDPDPDDPEKAKCLPGEIYDPTAPSGLLPALSDRIEIIWYKPLSFYPDPITVGGSDYFMNSRKGLPPPLGHVMIGVDAMHIPFIGKTMLIFHQRNRGQEGRFKRRLEFFGYSWRTHRTSPDHVTDLMWNGPDDFDNLWPLDSGINSRAGKKQNIDQLIYFRPDVKRPCAVLLPIGIARALYSMDTRRYVIRSFALP